MIVVSDIDLLPFRLFADNVSATASCLFCLDWTTLSRDDTIELELFVENLLITMFMGSTSRAIQASSGAKIIERGLKS